MQSPTQSHIAVIFPLISGFLAFFTLAAAAVSVRPWCSSVHTMGPDKLLRWDSHWGASLSHLVSSPHLIWRQPHPWTEKTQTNLVAALCGLKIALLPRSWKVVLGKKAISGTSLHLCLFVGPACAIYKSSDGSSAPLSWFITGITDKNESTNLTHQIRLKRLLGKQSVSSHFYSAKVPPVSQVNLF